jgi:hypothetical protein
LREAADGAESGKNQTGKTKYEQNDNTRLIDAAREIMADQT